MAQVPTYMKTKSKPKKYSRPTNWAPKPSVLIAERSKNLGWNPALAELVDNSFDAGAKNVRIILPSGVGDTFEISDDGCGCEDITIIMQQGARVRHDSSRSGKYGFGAKAAIIYIWGEVEIVSRLLNRTDTFHVDLNIAAQSDTWDDSIDCVEEANAATGLTIKIANVFRKPVEMDHACFFLSKTFWPAIEIGKQLSVCQAGRSIIVQKIREPDLQDEIEFEGEINGMPYQGFAGLTVGLNENPGFTLVKAHRVITTQFNDPLGGQNPGRFYGRVRLMDRNDSDWVLSTFKNDLEDDEIKSQLADELAMHCSELITQGDKLEREMFLDDLSAQFSEELFGLKKPRLRGPVVNPGSGTVEPVGTGKTRVAKEKDSGIDGSGTAPGPVRGGVVEIAKAPLGERVGKVITNWVQQGAVRRKHYLILLSESRPEIQKLFISRKATPLKVLALTLLCNHICSESGERAEIAERLKTQKAMINVEEESARETFLRLIEAWLPRITKNMEE